MKSNYLMSRIGGAALGISLLLGLGMVSTASAQRQWPDQNRDRRDQNRDREYRRDQERARRDQERERRDRNRDDRYGRGGYGNGGYGTYGYQAARDRGYQDGLQTGANDANRRQSYDPQRSHYYRNATDGYNGSFGNKDAYRRAYRDAFVRGYDEGFRRYSGNRRYGNGNGRWFPW